MYPHATTKNPVSHDCPDPCGLAPSGVAGVDLAPVALAPIEPLATIEPLALAPIRRGRRSAVRVRAGVVRQGRAMRHLASEVGQGTVEYVGLLLLMATLLAGVVAASKTLGGNDKIGKQLVEQIGNNIDKAGEGSKK